MTRFGISVALLTPFAPDGAIDADLLGQHARSVLERGAAGVTLFGTTGEGASIAAQERLAAIQTMLDMGIAPDQITVGICATSAGDAVAQVSQAFDAGVSRFLILPPYYFKGCDDAGLFEWHSQVLDQTDPACTFILYHIPQVSGVPLTLELVGKLAALGNGRITAIKDSSGSWDNTAALLRQKALPVLVGDERLLHRAAALGAAGSICGMANLHTERVVTLFETATEDKALSEDVTEVLKHPVVPAIKVLLAERTGQAGWTRVRAPLTPLDPKARTSLLAAMREPA